MLAALFTAVTAVAAVISVPLPFTPVPVTLASMAAILAGTVLGPKYGTLSQAAYLLLGTAGLPVFHNFTGGAGILMGPTGGFLAGYLLMALVAGTAAKDTQKISSLIAAGATGTLACYVTGTAWFIITTGTGFGAALVSCILPFIAGDILKIIAAAFMARRLKPVICR